jgi:carbonic anhydrase/acetyltransferase-like protein (isoleucine patch superfamily)
VCGDVTVEAGSRILFGSSIDAEGQPLELGEKCIVMENAVIRSTDSHHTRIGSHCLIGPHAHLVGCTAEDCVFIATGASVFHGATLRHGSEVRINAVMHLRTELPRLATVPIGWVAEGNPAQILPPDHHEDIWAIQKPLNFPKFVYGAERPAEGESAMVEITRRRSAALGNHRDDIILPE